MLNDTFDDSEDSDGRQLNFKDTTDSDDLLTKNGTSQLVEVDFWKHQLACFFPFQIWFYWFSSHHLTKMVCNATPNVYGFFQGSFGLFSGFTIYLIFSRKVLCKQEKHTSMASQKSFGPPWKPTWPYTFGHQNHEKWRVLGPQIWVITNQKWRERGFPWYTRWWFLIFSCSPRNLRK